MSESGTGLPSRDVCAVLNNELLAEALRQPLTHQACDDVGCATGGEADDDAHRARRIGLRACDPRDAPQCGGARGQMQKISTGKFHWALPRSIGYEVLSTIRS
jgi:hypothetical protein